VKHHHQSQELTVCAELTQKFLYRGTLICHIKVWRAFGLAVIITNLFLPFWALGPSPSVAFWLILKWRLIFGRCQPITFCFFLCFHFCGTSNWMLCSGTCLGHSIIFLTWSVLFREFSLKRLSPLLNPVRMWLAFLLNPLGIHSVCSHFHLRVSMWF
jgi:hypothetical protein